MTEIYLIRHTQAEGNLYRMMQGQWDGNVTELGLQQIDALAERFKNIHVDAVYSSDLSRTLKTASAVTKYNDLEIIPDPLLREIDMGSWETLYFGNVSHEYPEMAKAFVFDPDKWIVDGAETFQQVKDRVYPELLRIAGAHDGETVAVVSHGVAIKCMLSSITGKPLSDREAVPICNNTAVTKLIYDNGSFSIEYVNDASHLEGIGIPAWGRNHDLRDECYDPASDPSWYKKCYADAWKFARGSIAGYDENTYYRRALEHFKADPRSVLKIFDKDVPVGLIDMDPLRGADEDYGWISLIYLIPEYRFNGYGIQLLSRAIFYYRALGRSALRLTVNKNNTAALSFYKKHGFAAVKSSERDGIILLEAKLGGNGNVWSSGKN